MSKKSRNSTQRTPKTLPALPNDPKRVSLPQPTNKPIQQPISNTVETPTVTTGLIKTTTNTPTTGSPTTGNSGLVSEKVTTTPRDTRAVANVNIQKEKELRISQKRMLATSMSRKYTRAEPIINKLVRMFLDRNIIKSLDDIQLLNTGIRGSDNRYDFIININQFKGTEPKQQVYLTKINIEDVLKPQFEKIEVKTDNKEKLINIGLFNYIDPTLKARTRQNKKK